MDFVSITILFCVSFIASGLTFFSGFGLGTILTPVFYMMFNDLTLAISATAIVHVLNNVFKYVLMQKKVNWGIALPFGVAAIPAAILGAFLTQYFSRIELFQFSIFNYSNHIIVINLIFGLILIAFALIELIPKLQIAFSKQKLWLGGTISGFFGGLSGHQGALRTAFLVKYQLDKQTFIATGIIIALIIDFVRIPIYISSLDGFGLKSNWISISFALLGALIGAIVGKFYLKKVKLESLNIFISYAMLVFGLALALGFLEINEK